MKKNPTLIYNAVGGRRQEKDRYLQRARIFKEYKVIQKYIHSYPNLEFLGFYHCGKGAFHIPVSLGVKG